ncbi:MAG: thioredoxin [Firmicutes bacterium]|nr:thioredoxin [Bacillota bacterium]
MAEITSLNKSNFKEQVLEESLPVLVDFTAPWCGPCQMIGPVLDELATEYQGRLKIVKVNVDENPELSSEYRVMGVPTLILFKQGEPTETMVGFLPKNQLASRLDALI